MKVGYMFPSGNYNIVLSKEELQQLVDGKGLCFTTSKVECHTGRGVWNPEGNCIETHDRKEIYNELLFRTREPVDDIEPGDHYVQFLCINVHD